jgi:hypothetical protein
MQELLKRTDLMANGRWRHAKFGRGTREAQMSGGRLECAQSIQRYIRSHARAPIDANPPRSTAFPIFAPGLHETRQRTSSNFSQIRAETLGAMGAARMHDSRSADLFDGLLSGKNPPWGMTGGSRRRRSRVQKAYADHYKLNGLGKSCQVWLRCPIRRRPRMLMLKPGSKASSMPPMISVLVTRSAGRCFGRPLTQTELSNRRKLGCP